MQISYAFQQCKSFENRLRFDKVTESLKVGTFFETQCILQVKRVPGASGRMRKNEEGEWEWSDDGECTEDVRPKAAAAVSVCVDKIHCCVVVVLIQVIEIRI